MEKRIDLNSNPFIPKGSTIIAHKEQTELNPSGLFLPTEQNTGKDIYGRKIQSELRINGIKPSNALALDYLLQNQSIIWDEFKKLSRGVATRYVYFWNTIYKDTKGEFVRGMFFDFLGKHKYCSCKKYIDEIWKFNHQAATLG